LWLLSLVNRFSRQAVKTYVNKWVKQWWASVFGKYRASQRYTVMHDVVSHGRLFTKLFRVFPWSYEFLRHPTVSVLTRYYTKELVDASLFDDREKVHRGLIDFIQTEARVMPLDDVVGVFHWLSDHSNVLYLHAKFLSARKVDEPEDPDEHSFATLASFLYYVILTGRVDLLDCFFQALPVTKTKKMEQALVDYVLSAAFVSGSVAMAHRIMGWCPHTPALGLHIVALASCHSEELMAVTLGAVAPGVEECKHETRVLEGFIDSVIHGHGSDLITKPQAARGLRRFLDWVDGPPPDRHHLRLLAWALADPYTVYKLLPLARDSEVLTDQVVADIWMPVLAQHVFAGVGGHRRRVDPVSGRLVRPFTEEELEDRMDRCGCTGHRICRVLREAGFPPHVVRFTNEQVQAVIDAHRAANQGKLPESDSEEVI
jgi:hypothetical protein